MKTSLKILFLFVILNSIFICYGKSFYFQSSPEIIIQTDTTKSRYYEAPYGELPYGYFKIIDTSSIIVYSQKAHHRRYGSYLKYYYSLNIKSRIHELSFDNLQVDFADNPKFIKLIENTKSALHTIYGGITLVNGLLEKSLK